MDDTTAIAEVTTMRLSAETAEHVLATGDLSLMTAQQRVEYVVHICNTLGLNPATRPIRFLNFQGQVQAYFTRDGCDQLRRLHNISLHVIDQRIDADVLQVRVQARMPSGREDEDIGAVTLPRSGDFRANAMMKCLTKAKRRVTLSICGLGFLSEDELDTMAGVQTFDHDAELPPPAPPQPPTARDRQAAQYDAGPPKPPSPQRPDAAWRQWVDTLQARLAPLTEITAIEEMAERRSVLDAIEHGPTWVQDETRALFAETRERAAKYAATEADAELPPIVGEDKAVG